MGNTRNTYRTVLSTLGGATLIVGLAACTTGQPGAAGSVEPTPGDTSIASAPTPTPTPTVTRDPAVTAAWAAEAVPGVGSTGFLFAQNGQFPDDAPGSFSLTVSTLPAGSYSLYVACRGDADTTVTVTVDNDDESTLAGGCSDLTQGMTFSTATVGAAFSLVGDSEEPVEWAVAITDLLPGAEG